MARAASEKERPFINAIDTALRARLHRGRSPPPRIFLRRFSRDTREPPTDGRGNPMLSRQDIRSRACSYYYSLTRITKSIAPGVMRAIIMYSRCPSIPSGRTRVIGATSLTCLALLPSPLPAAASSIPPMGIRGRKQVPNNVPTLCEISYANAEIRGRPSPHNGLCHIPFPSLFRPYPLTLRWLPLPFSVSPPLSLLSCLCRSLIPIPLLSLFLSFHPCCSYYTRCPGRKGQYLSGVIGQRERKSSSANAGLNLSSTTRQERVRLCDLRSCVEISQRHLSRLNP